MNVYQIVLFILDFGEFCGNHDEIMLGKEIWTSLGEMLSNSWACGILCWVCMYWLKLWIHAIIKLELDTLRLVWSVFPLNIYMTTQSAYKLEEMSKY